MLSRYGFLFPLRLGFRSAASWHRWLHVFGLFQPYPLILEPAEGKENMQMN